MDLVHFSLNIGHFWSNRINWSASSDSNRHGLTHAEGCDDIAAYMTVLQEHQADCISRNSSCSHKGKIFAADVILTTMLIISALRQSAESGKEIPDNGIFCAFISADTNARKP